MKVLLITEKAYYTILAELDAKDFETRQISLTGWFQAYYLVPAPFALYSS